LLTPPPAKAAAPPARRRVARRIRSRYRRRETAGSLTGKPSDRHEETTATLRATDVCFTEHGPRTLPVAFHRPEVRQQIALGNRESFESNGPAAASRNG
jgi:hypothetical protein